MMKHCKTLLAGLAVVLALGGGARAADDTAEADEAFLRQAGVRTDGPSLLTFFRGRTLSAAGRQQLQALLRDLGDTSFGVRQQAARKVVAVGPPALAALKEAGSDPDLEVRRRAEWCTEMINRGPGASLPAAAARFLVIRKPAGAVTTLLD